MNEEKHDKVKENDPKVFSLISFHLIWYYVQYILILFTTLVYFLCVPKYLSIIIIISLFC